MKQVDAGAVPVLPGGDERGCERMSRTGQRKVLFLQCRLYALLRVQVIMLYLLFWLDTY